MSGWDNFLKKASDKKDDAVQAAKDMQEKSRLNSAITQEQKKIEGAYKAIGEIYFNKFSNEPGEEFKEAVDQINVSLKKIAECQKQIQILGGVVICEKCGAKVPAGMDFCGSCGTKIKKMGPMTETREDDTPVCKKCGARLAPGTRFCTSCGTPVEETAPKKEEFKEEATETVCPNCGAKLEPDSLFCIECGAKVG